MGSDRGIMAKQMQGGIRTVDICVIGCGPGGLISMKEMMDAGFKDVVGLESQEGPGGLFRTFYYGGSLTSSWTYTAFSHFPPRDYGVSEDNPSHWTGPEYCKYLEAFADRFNLTEHITYNSKVTNLEPDGDEWLVESEQVTYKAKRVIVASGTNQRGKIPSYPGDDTFKGSIMHSRDYSHPDIFKEKRILVVGSGETGADICMQAGEFGKSCHLSVRGGRMGHQTPRNVVAFKNVVLSDAADLDINMVSTSIPWKWAGLTLGFRDTLLPLVNSDLYVMNKCNFLQGSWANTQFGTKTGGISVAVHKYGVKFVPEIKSFEGDVVNFVDGTALPMDVVVYATGFAPTFGDFITSGDKQLAGLVEKAKTCSRNLFKRTFGPEMSDKIAFVGLCRPAFGNIPTECEMEARYIGGLWTGKYQLPSMEDQKAIMARDHAMDPLMWSAKRVVALNNYIQFTDGLSRQMPETRPKWMKMFFTGQWGLLTRIYIGQFNVSTFRLNSENPETVARAKKTLMGTPVNPFALFDTHIGFCFYLGYLFGINCFKPTPLPDLSPLTRIACASAITGSIVCTGGLAAIALLPSFYIFALCTLTRCFNPPTAKWLWRTLIYGEGKIGVRHTDGTSDTLFDYFSRFWFCAQSVMFILLSLPVSIPTATVLRLLGIKVVPAYYSKGHKQI